MPVAGLEAVVKVVIVNLMVVVVMLNAIGMVVGYRCSSGVGGSSDVGCGDDVCDDVCGINWNPMIYVLIGG